MFGWTAGTRAACINAASIALADAGIPMRDLVVSCAAGYLNSTPLLGISVFYYFYLFLFLSIKKSYLTIDLFILNALKKTLLNIIDNTMHLT